MTYNVTIEEPRGDYVKLEEGFDGGANGEASTSSGCAGGDGGWCWSLWWWLKLVLVLTFLGVLAAVVCKWVGPFFMDKMNSLVMGKVITGSRVGLGKKGDVEGLISANKEIIPIIHWETETFSAQVLALLVFGSVALFPILLLPSSPSMWVAGMTFGYGYGFLLVIGAVPIGVSLPYFIGYLFRHKMHMWLERYPKKASIIRLAGEGNWFNQVRAVTLIRISPFPYVIYNYSAVATSVGYGPYLLGSLVGMVPEVFVALYTGILIKTLADASRDQHSLSASQIIFDVVGFCITVAATVIITLYGKRRLNELQRDDGLLQ